MEKSRTAWLRAVFAVGLMGATASVMSSDAGLGTSWPNAPDLSRHVNFHAYKWVQGRVAYVQVNAANGSPIFAIASRGGSVMVLPVGHPELVQVGQGGGAPIGQAVYHDDTLDVSVADGGFTVIPAASAVAPCSDPIECSKPQAVSAPVMMRAEETCSDPIECSKPSASP